MVTWKKPSTITVDFESSGAESIISRDTTVNAVDELSDTEFILAVEELQTETRRLDIENQVFQNFLLTSDPTLLMAMDKILEFAQKVKTRKYISLSHSDQGSQSSDHSDQTSVLFRGSARPTISVDNLSRQRGQGTGPRINISLKSDLVLRELGDMQKSLENVVKKSQKIKFKLKAEIEESTIRDAEVQEARDIFELSIVTNAVDKLTQKIPAEKFDRYLQEWLRSAQFTLEKLRLKTSAIKIQFSKLKGVLAQKKEIGQSVHEVDFERLRIENKHLLLKIEQKNSHLLELKRLNGRSNLMLTTHKKVLQQQSETLKKIKAAVSQSRQRIVELEKESVIAGREIEIENGRLRHIEELIRKYKVPDVMKYIHKKSELEDLRKVMKTWNRKCTIQKTAIETYTRNMKYMTGLSKPRASWFELFRRSSDVTFSDDDSSASTTSI